MAAFFAGSCGLSQAPIDSGSSPTSSLAESASTGAPSTLATAADHAWSPTVVSAVDYESDVARLFADLARTLAPLTVYGLSELPPGASIAAEWWPALSMDSPSDYHGPIVANPRVSDSPQGSQEAQVLLKLGDGWLLILENFRGDLGEVTGSAVGTVAGRPATLYEVADGVLVQWSDQGAWYGVFGRGIGAEEVVRTALSVTTVDPGD